MEYNFEWDPAKAKINVTKHGINFGESSSIFLDPNTLSIFDKNHSESEDRWITIGLNKFGKLIVVCHTFSQEKGNTYIRIISARKATKNEIKQYNER